MHPAQLQLLVLIGAISAVRIPVPDQRAVNAPAIIASPEAGRMIRTLPTPSLVCRTRQMLQSADLLPALLSLTRPVEVAEPGGAVTPLPREHVAALVLLLTLVTAVLTVLCPITHLVTLNTSAIITSPASPARVLVTTVSAGELGHETGVTDICLTLSGETLSSPPTLVMSPASEARTARVWEEVTSLMRLPTLV